MSCDADGKVIFIGKQNFLPLLLAALAYCAIGFWRVGLPFAMGFVLVAYGAFLAGGFTWSFAH